MLATFDIADVRRFAAELDQQRQFCDGEGTFCSDLEASLACIAQVCERLREAIDAWATAVFSGEITYETEVEDIFRLKLREALEQARPLVKRGRSVLNECFGLESLELVESYVSSFEFLENNWISPMRAVAPAARNPISDDAAKKIHERAKQLSPLPADWRPTDSRQSRLFSERPE